MSLQDDLLTLVELDRQVIRSISERDAEGFQTALVQYLNLRKSIKTHILDRTVASIDNADSLSVLRKITTGEGLPSDKLFNRLSAESGSGHPEDFDDADVDELGSDLFYSWYSHHDYIRGITELRPMVVRSTAAKNVDRLIRQIKNCYAFQQYDAAYGLCRTLIEASIRDICLRCQLFPDLGENVILFEEFKWNQLRDKVSSGALRERLKHLYSELCTLLHARKSVTRDEARRAFEETLQVVEQLYAAHDL